MDTNSPDRKAALSAAKRALLEQRLRGGGDAGGRGPEIPGREQQNHIPLSFSQQRLWVLEQLEPGSAAYNISRLFGFSGALDRAALQNALNAIVARHESLRTSVGVVEGRPSQVILPVLTLALPVEDLSDVSEADQNPELHRRAGEEARRPFDLGECPLLRVRLFTRAPMRHSLLLTMHHIVGDIWSLELFVRELSSLYAAFAEGKPSPLADLPIQYGDYAVWQQSSVANEGMHRQVAYWKAQLASPPAALELPFDKPRPEHLSLRGSYRTTTLPKELSERLKAVGRLEHATFSMVVLAAFNVLLSRYSNQQDILVGTPVAGRNRVQTESLIGCFINTLVLRTDLSGDPTFRELLCRVKDRTLEAYTHQDVPFELLVQELRPGRGVGHSPFFQVMLDVHTADAAGGSGSGSWLREAVEIDRGGARADLLLFVSDEPRSFDCWLEYSTDLFAPETISGMLAHFEVLLRGIVAVPDGRVSELPLLPDAERQQILIRWNQTKADYPCDTCFLQVFASQVERMPEAIALVFQDQQLTYDALDRRANRLARYLQRLGVGAEDTVGVFVSRSADLIVALLAVLKTGAAYVPLDPEFPAARLRFMIEDSKVAVLLTEERLAGELPPHGALTVRIDADSQAIAAEDDRNAPCPARPDDRAYVIYTSGSTGQPKGVEITHRAVMNHLWSMRQQPGMTSEDVLLAVTTASFDISVLEFFLPLVTGGRLVVASRDVAADGALLTRAIGDSGATIMQGTPATWRMLVDAGWTGTHGLKVLCGGEALSRDLANQLLPRCASLWNLYGPTETTIWSAAGRVEGTTGPVSIGRPIANTRIYILDPRSSPVPARVTGELHIAGDGLARGYLNQPALTAEKFVVPTHGALAGERLYKTGDLARYLPDGTIECLGRIDSQVKLRGYRIELSEIDAVLTEHDDVSTAVTILAGDRPESRHLVSYVVPVGGRAVNGAELKRYLGDRLPDYMVPFVLVEMAALPLTPNGKVDRKALPAPARAAAADSEFVAPRTPGEEVLAQIWCGVLKLPRVGVTDNFFDLGGHSLLATQLLARVRDSFGVELPLRRLFEKPTVEQLSGVIQQATAAPARRVAPAIVPVSRHSRRVKPAGEA